MRAYLKLFLLSTITAGAAWLASRAFVPDAVAVADIEQQPQWYLQFAFVLRSIELIGLGGMALVLVAGLVAWLGRPLQRRGFAKGDTVAVHRESLP